MYIKKIRLKSLSFITSSVTIQTLSIDPNKQIYMMPSIHLPQNGSISAVVIHPRFIILSKMCVNVIQFKKKRRKTIFSQLIALTRDYTNKNIHSFSFIADRGLIFMQIKNRK